MRFPSTLACILVFVFWLTYELRKNSSSAKKEKSFLELDAEANSVRKKPLDTLHYITIPIESLPFFSGIDEKLTSYQETIQNLNKKPIVNLSGITNVDLKMEYGAANLPILSQYDQNFTLLARTLLQWGTRLHELGYQKEAIQVLSFGIDCQTDARGNYILLAQLYRQQGNTDAIYHLIQVAETLRTSQKDGICRDLKTYL